MGVPTMHGKRYIQLVCGAGVHWKTVFHFMENLLHAKHFTYLSQLILTVIFRGKNYFGDEKTEA